MTSILYIKNFKLEYEICSQSFAQLCGLSNVKNILGKTDNYLRLDYCFLPVNRLDCATSLCHEKIVFVKSRQVLWPLFLKGFTKKILTTQEKFAGLYGYYEIVSDYHKPSVKQFINYYCNRALSFHYEGMRYVLTKSELKFLFFYLNKINYMSLKCLSNLVGLKYSTVYTYVRNLKDKFNTYSAQDLATFLSNSSFYKEFRKVNNKVASHTLN